MRYIDALIAELKYFCTEHDLPHKSAPELLEELDIPDAPTELKEWLKDYIERWNDMLSSNSDDSPVDTGLCTFREVLQHMATMNGGAFVENSQARAIVPLIILRDAVVPNPFVEETGRFAVSPTEEYGNTAYSQWRKKSMSMLASTMSSLEIADLQCILAAEALKRSNRG